MTLEGKLKALQRALRDYGSLAVAFSGGVDSSFLLKSSHDVLGDRVLALTVDSVFVPRSEVEEAVRFCSKYGIRQMLVPMDVLSIPEVVGNPPDRCYYCKRTLFSRMKEITAEEGIALLAEGSNVDDDGDYRPGMRAIAELQILSPLKDAGLSKAEIRELSRQMGLPSWDKPSMACLASRIAYHETIDKDKLSAVEQAEELLRSLRIRQCRVRVHGTMARLEVLPEDFPIIIGQRDLLVEKLSALGFKYITLDLEGFQSGSMNKNI